MKKRKILSAALAAGLAFGSLSAVSYAEGTNNREASGYSITLENTTVEGKEMAAVIFNGLPKEVFDIDYTIIDGNVHIHETVMGQNNDHNVIWVSDFSTCSTSVCIDLGEKQEVRFRAGSYNDNKWEAWSFNDERDEREFHQIVAEEQGDTITLTAYLDLNNKYLKSLAAKEEWTVSVYADVTGNGGSYYDTNDDGHISDDEKGGCVATGDAFELVEIKPNKKIELHNLDDWYTAPKETIKITNNLTGVAPIEEKMFEDIEIEVSEGIDDDVKSTLRGIRVTDSLGAFDADVVMNVKGISQTERSFSYDITFTKDGEEVQPREKVTVKVPIPTFLKNCTIVVRHFNENGSVEKISSKIENGFVIYTADHFSVYELSAQEQQITNTNKPQNSSSSLKTSASETSAPAASNTNPNTGISVSLAPAIIAAGAAAVALNNKKRR